MRLIAAFVVSSLTFVLIDAVWLSTVAIGLFKAHLGSLLREQPNLAAAAAFYLIYCLGLMTLAVAPSLREGSAKAAFWRGAMLGLTAYATFDLTNLAVLAGWNLTVSLVDMAWGTLATAIASLAGFAAGRLVGRNADATNAHMRSRP